MSAFARPKTQRMRNFLLVEGPQGLDRVTGLSIEDNGVFIYTNSKHWCDDHGSGTFRGDSETAAIFKFYDRVRCAE